MSWCSRGTLICLACLCLRSGARADSYPTQQFVGEYTEVSTSESNKRIDEAIVKATAPMGLLARAVAKRRLKAVNTAYATIQIAQRGDVLTTSFSGWPYVSTVDGRWARNIDPDGRTVDVSYSVEGNVLHARYVGTDGEKQFDLVAAQSGQTISAQVTMLSKRIPRPVQYKLWYVKGR